MFVDGRWVKWDGRDTDKLMVEEQFTLTELKNTELKKYFPYKYEEIKNNL